MGIKIKAVERLVKFDANSTGEYRYILSAELYNKLTASKVIQEAAFRSGIAKGTINASWSAIGEVIKAWATEGHSVEIPGLGTMRFGVRATSVTDVNDVAANLITSRRVIFTPNVDIKKELSGTNVSITCYDRDGEIVRQVLSVDEGDVDDDTNPQNTPTTGKKTVTLTVSPTNAGTVTGAGQYDAGATATLTATAASGYTFSKWSDNNTNASRSVTVNSDMSLVAQFTATGGGGNEGGGYA